MVSRSECDMVSIVSRCRYANWPRASYVSVAQHVWQRLEFVSRKVIVIPQHVVVCRTARALCGKVELWRLNKSRILLLEGLLNQCILVVKKCLLTDPRQISTDVCKLLNLIFLNSINKSFYENRPFFNSPKDDHFERF